MFDFTLDQPTIGSSFIYIVLYFCYLLFYYCRIVRKRPLVKYTTVHIFFCFLLILFAWIDSDWFHYEQLVWNYNLSPGAHNHGEEIYRFIIAGVDKNYFLFRVIVWGGALWCLIKSFKLCKIDVNVGLFVLMTVFLLRFSYSRATLGMAVYFLGLSLLLTKSNVWFGIRLLLALICFYLAYLFHNSLIAVIALTVVIYLPINKYGIILAIILIPGIAYVLSSYLDELMMSAFVSNNEYLQGRLLNNNAVVAEKQNFWGLFFDIAGYATSYVPLIISAVIINKNRERIDKAYIRMLKLTFAIVIFSAAFIFMPFDSLLYYYRYLFMAFIPTIIITVYLFQNGFMKLRSFKIIIWVGLFYTLYRIFLVFYKELMGVGYAID